MQSSRSTSSPAAVAVDDLGGVVGLDVPVDDALRLAASRAGWPGRSRGSRWRGPRRRLRAPPTSARSASTTSSAPCARQPVPAHTAMTLRRASRPATSASRRLASAAGSASRALMTPPPRASDLLHHAGDLLGGHVPVVLAVEEDERPERAGADAADLLDAEREVGRRAAGADAGVALELLEQPRRAAHVAGGAHAHGAGVLAARLGVEAVVEGGDAVDLRRRQAEVRRPSRRSASSGR